MMGRIFRMLIADKFLVPAPNNLCSVLLDHVPVWMMFTKRARMELSVYILLEELA